jgi:hypothetical protein
MWMALHVFFRGELPSRAALSRAVKELGFPFTIAARGGPLDPDSGFLRMRLKREETGVGFGVFDGRDNIEAICPDLDLDASFERTASFGWAGDATRMLCALCAAAAFARLTNGVVLSKDDQRPLAPDEAIAVARQHLEAVAKRKDKPQPRTRPSDIKRYLKPLLKQRSDLVLIGQYLIIRPVRHLLRGAFLERTSDKYGFRIMRRFRPLYDPDDAIYGDYICVGAYPVWQPHFEALLMDALAEDVFAKIGRVTALASFADTLTGDARRDYPSACVRALVLAGERERAAEYVRESERRDPGHTYWVHWARQQRKFLARDIDAVCAEAHAKEAATVKAMKLEALWEPSPFPVELPAHERARSAEHDFPMAPWIATPSWLLQDLPEVAGDVRFAKDFFRRQGRQLMLVPLSRDDAESRHRNGEPYVLFVRQADGRRVRMRSVGVDREDPHHSGLPGRVFSRFRLDLDGMDYRIIADFVTNMPSDGMLYIESIVVDRRDADDPVWHCIVKLDGGEVEITDRRGPEITVTTDRALTVADREIATFPIPDFGDYDGLVTRLHAWLRHAGFGEIA